VQGWNHQKLPLLDTGNLLNGVLQILFRSFKAS